MNSRHEIELDATLRESVNDPVRDDLLEVPFVIRLIVDLDDAIVLVATAQDRVNNNGVLGAPRLELLNL